MEDEVAAAFDEIRQYIAEFPSVNDRITPAGL
jgi:hypothetical protein